MEAHRKLRKIILYGDLSLDIIDGSAVWLVSMAQVLASTYSEVHLLLKNTPHRSILTESLAQVDDLHIHTPKNNDGEPVTLNSITEPSWVLFRPVMRGWKYAKEVFSIV